MAGRCRRHDDRCAGVARAAQGRALPEDERGHPRQGSARAVHLSRAVHVQGRPGLRRRRRSRSPARRGDGPLQHHASACSTCRPTRSHARQSSEHPDRFVASFNVDPNEGMEAVRKLDAAARELDVRSAQCFPAGLLPQVPINDKKMYPLYAKCVELDIPIFVNAGVPGPAGADGLPGRRAHRRGVLVLPRAEVRDAPRRRAVDRARDEAHAQVAEPLLLHESAFAPKHYPDDIVYFANTAAPTR